MSSEWQSVADQPVAPADNRPFILDWLHYSEDTINPFNGPLMFLKKIQNILQKNAKIWQVKLFELQFPISMLANII